LPPPFNPTRNSPTPPHLTQSAETRETESKHGIALGLKGIHSIFRNPLTGSTGGRPRAKQSNGGRQDTGHAAALNLLAPPGKSSKGGKRQGTRRQSTGFDLFGLGGGSGGRSKSKSKRSKGRSKKEQSTGGFDFFGLGGESSGSAGAPLDLFGSGAGQQPNRPPLDILGDGDNVGGPPPIAGERSQKTTGRKLSELV